MSWKDLPSWAKGGIIGIGLYIFLSYFYFFSGTFSKSLQHMLGFVAYLNMPTSILLKIVPHGIASEEIGWIIIIFGTLFLSPALYFLIGALVGYLIQKIKERKSSQNL